MTSHQSAMPHSDTLARVLRERGVENVSGASTLASCFLPLLEALRWSGDVRDVAESFPHFADDVDIVDLRNAFVELGYDSHPSTVTLSNLDERLLPCLFECKDGDVYPVFDRTESGFVIWRNGENATLPLDEAHMEGTAYFFTLHESDNREFDSKLLGWFGKAVSRFKQAIRMLLVVSFFTNILAIIFPLIIMFIYDRVIGGRSPDTLPYIFLGVIIILTADLSFRLIRTRIVGFVAGRLDYIIGAATFEKILTLPPAYTERAAVSAQLSRIKEFESLRDFFTGPLAMTVLELPYTLITLGVIALIGGKLALIPFFTLAGFTALSCFVLPRVKTITRESGTHGTKRDDMLVETLMQMRSVKEMGAESMWLNRYRLTSARAAQSQHQAEFQSAIMDALSHGLIVLSGILILVVGTYSVLNGTSTIGALIATMILSWRVLAPIQTGFLAYTKLDQIKRSLLQLNNLMKMQAEGNQGKSRLLKEDIEGEVIFNRVSYRYSADSDPALLGATFRIPKGSLVSVIGSNSSGKSTVIKLISGLYQPQGGTITIGGVDLRQVDPQELRQNIAYVPQQAHVFYGTIAQNLRLSEPLASDQDIENATKLIGLYDMVQSLPEGFETRIGDGHTEDLPPGFMQRLNIARALIRKSDIILLDEPAQSLDYDGDQVFMDLLQSLKGQRTIIMVSHRPSHVRLSDSVLVFNHGVLEYQGAPDDALTLAQKLGHDKKDDR